MRLQESVSLGLMATIIAFVAMPCSAQPAVENHPLSQPVLTGTHFKAGFYPSEEIEKRPSSITQELTDTFLAMDDSLKDKSNRKTTSLTGGYLTDVFSIQSTDGSYRFRFDGRATGLQLSSKSSSLMLTYGITQAQEHEGDIRSITADLNLGGNITLFKRFLGLPIEAFIPIRFNLGYRNLELLDNPDSDLSSTANIGTGSLGGGLGAQIRIPTGLPVLKDNITAFAHLVKSAGAIGDFESLGNNAESAGQALGGIRLTQSTDLYIEAKFERLLGGNTGVTAGMTVRWMHWADEEAEDLKQILDVVSGKQEGLQLRTTQTFFRVGINW